MRVGAEGEGEGGEGEGSTHHSVIIKRLRRALHTLGARLVGLLEMVGHPQLPLVHLFKHLRESRLAGVLACMVGVRGVVCSCKLLLPDAQHTLLRIKVSIACSSFLTTLNSRTKRFPTSPSAPISMM